MTILRGKCGELCNIEVRPKIHPTHSHTFLGGPGEILVHPQTSPSITVRETAKSSSLCARMLVQMAIIFLARAMSSELRAVLQMRPHNDQFLSVEQIVAICQINIRLRNFKCLCECISISCTRVNTRKWWTCEITRGNMLLATPPREFGSASTTHKGSFKNSQSGKEPEISSLDLKSPGTRRWESAKTVLSTPLLE